MGYVIALAGKGGTGKSTVAALLVRLLREERKGSVLAIDADPNSNLSELLGLGPAQATIGTILDDVAAHPGKIPAGMSKDRFIEYEIHKSIQEGDGFDVLTMGKPEGPGCYCYVNNCLRGVAATLIKDYDYVVIDNEAGLEHFSRRTTRSADVLLVISDATVVGLRAAQKIHALVRDLQIKTGRRMLLVNRSEAAAGEERIKATGLEYLGSIPQDEAIAQASIQGGSLLEIEPRAAGLEALRRLKERILCQAK